jgi:hypothetical protein
MLKERTVINSYEKLIKKQQALMNKMSNISRERDYRLKKIENRFDAKIDCLVREQEALNLIVDATQEYVRKINYDKAEVITKATHKKREG